jgi:ABC-2 type transport system permease protein
MVKKELRLLIRDPTLLSQVLLRTLYVLPLTFLLARNAMRSRGDPIHTAVRFHGLGTIAYGSASSFSVYAGAGALAFLAGQVAGSLAWITISAEEAPELLACAPVDGERVRQAKLTATMVPVALLLIAPLCGLAAFAPWVGAAASVGAAGSAVSAGLINLWFEKPASRKAFRSRRGGSVLGAIAELIMGLGWGVTTGMIAALSPYAVIPAAITLLTLGLFYGLANPVKGY